MVNAKNAAAGHHILRSCLGKIQPTAAYSLSYCHLTIITIFLRFPGIPQSYCDSLAFGYYSSVFPKCTSNEEQYELESDMGFEPTPTVWKTVMLAADTNPTYKIFERHPKNPEPAAACSFSSFD